MKIGDRVRIKPDTKDRTAGKCGKIVATTDIYWSPELHCEWRVRVDGESPLVLVSFAERELELLDENQTNQ